MNVTRLTGPFPAYLGLFGMRTSPLARYNIGGKAPAVVADFSAGVYGINGAPVAFDGLFSFARLSAAWKRNALGHWVKVLAGEPRTGHHIWQGGQLVPAGVAICSEVRTQFLPYASAILENWGSPDSDLFDVGDDFVRVTSLGGTLFPRVGWASLGIGSGTKTVQAEFRESTSGEAILRVFGVAVGGGGENSSVYRFNFATQAFTKVAGADAIGTFVQDLGNGVFRLAFSFIADSISSINVYPRWSEDTPDMSVDFRYPMISEGPYPADFIPNTTGSQVSIAAETLQINDPVLARAIGSPGPELVDTTWINNDPNTLVSDGDQLTLTRQIGASEVVAASNPETLTAGETYLLSIPILSRKNNFPVGLYHGTTRIAQSDEVGTFEVVYTPGTTTTDTFVLRLRGPSDVQSSAVIKQPSLRPVTMPEALTFLMKGTMTRAKEPEGYDNAVPFRWKVDTDNYTDLIVSAYGAHTGKPYFRSKIGGTLVERSGPDDALALGVEEDFALAFVLSSTEIEGFYNGVSTGQIAHGGMANLLSAPLQIFPVGNAAVKEIRVWPEALPSADMVEATA